MSGRLLKSLIFFVAAGLLKKENLRYLDSESRTKIRVDENTLDKAQIMKDILLSIQETYIWKDRRFVRK